MSHSGWQFDRIFWPPKSWPESCCCLPVTPTKHSGIFRPSPIFRRSKNPIELPPRAIGERVREVREAYHADYVVRIYHDRDWDHDHLQVGVRFKFPLRGLPYMTSAKCLDFFTPTPCTNFMYSTRAQDGPQEMERNSNSQACGLCQAAA